MYVFPKAGYVSYHYSVQISTNFILKDFIWSVEFIITGHGSIASGQLWGHYSLAVVRTKGDSSKGDEAERESTRPEEQGEKRREMVSLLGTLMPVHEGNVPLWRAEWMASNKDDHQQR